EYSSGSHRIMAVSFGPEIRSAFAAEAVVRVSNPPPAGVFPPTDSTAPGPENRTEKSRQEVNWINLLVDGRYLASPNYDSSFDSTQFSDGVHRISIEAKQDPDTLLGTTSILLDIANRDPTGTLVAGGYLGASIFGDTELYDPIARTFNV